MKEDLNMKKRIFLALILMSLLIAAFALADGDTDAWLSDWRYEVDQAADGLPGYLKLTKYIGSDSTINIPGTAVMDGTKYKVEVPGATSVFSYGSFSITTIFPEKVTSITINGATLAPKVNNMFHALKNLTSVTFQNVDASHVTEAARMFNNCTALTTVNWGKTDFSHVKYIDSLFSFCKSIREIDLTGVNLSGVTSMLSAFSSCPALEKVSLNGKQLSNVTEMGGIFAFDTSLKTIDLSGWDVRNVVSMACMFQDCSGLVSVNTSGWKTGKVTNMSSMFYGCTSLRTLDLTDFDMSSVLGMSGFFTNDTALEKIILGPKFKFVYQQDTSMEAAFPVTNGYGWKSAKTGLVYTRQQILENRNGIADTYTKVKRTGNENVSPDPTKAPVLGRFLNTWLGTFRLNNDGTATFDEPRDKKATSLSIPDTVESENTTYKVTAIKESACKGMSKLTTLVIGKNIETIGANAFANCKKLKSITISTTKLTAKSVGENAFKGINSKATVKCPSSKLKNYKSMLLKKGMKKTTKFKK